ncbi:hypothetical protein GCM10020366_62020 [Saccharopolyspora gregorii]|uniref:Uncharacterized protein n=1 Tax=Saccharopolyspora gregorii TaxID=33914 RepID=A0ABP6S0L5_9PSEU
MPIKVCAQTAANRLRSVLLTAGSVSRVFGTGVVHPVMPVAPLHSSVVGSPPRPWPAGQVPRLRPVPGSSFGGPVVPGEAGPWSIRPVALSGRTRIPAHPG